MQITESKLRQAVRQLIREEVYGTIATVYHGSRQPPEDFIKTFENESGLVKWQVNKGAGSSYGHGLYTVWEKTNHQTYKGGYGDWIYKFKVNLYGFIIFDETVCKKVYGSSISPVEQLKKIGKKQLLNILDTKTIEILEEPPVHMRISSEYALYVSKHLAGNVNGIVFFGSSDGPVVLIYDPNIVTPISYAHIEDAHDNIWTKWNSAKIKHSLSRSSQAGTIVDTERLQKGLKTNDEKIFLSLKKAKYNNSDSIKRLKQSSYNIKTMLIDDPSTPSAILTILSDDPDAKIRSRIAWRDDLSEELLNKLANDEDVGVIKEIILNPITPKETLIKLSNSTVNFIKSWAQLRLDGMI